MKFQNSPIQLKIDMYEMDMAKKMFPITTDGCGEGVVVTSSKILKRSNQGKNWSHQSRYCCRHQLRSRARSSKVDIVVVIN